MLSPGCEEFMVLAVWAHSCHEPGGLQCMGGSKPPVLVAWFMLSVLPQYLGGTLLV